ncbi:MAG: cob(I)yrinic acid a,c-diamide adenosyltransferase [Eubacterium sp.]|jgi:cob(I)alamin adenosyltransferase|nr:cob(I)yrinic acid a,c-diamide adenosyltransferase [Eubacterium sp.]
MNNFYTHIYAGDGKGKTSAAVGLAVRAAGSGKKVVFAQFFKGTDSGEISILKQFVTVIRLPKSYGFWKTLTEYEKKELTKEHNIILQNAVSIKSDVLILDEIISAYNYQAVDTSKVDALLEEKPQFREIILTGRNPSSKLIGYSDYFSEICDIKHVFAKGIKAREGIEY